MNRIFNKIKSIFKLIKEKINIIIRNKYLKKQKSRLINKTPSVFASNCVGCMVLHDLGLQFNSPFVNLYLNAKDYLKYLAAPAKYNEMEFVEIESEFSYPVGMLGDLKFHFVHYKSFDEAVSAFKRRVERINYDNLFIVFSERDGCTKEDLKEFDALKYKNKIVFTHKPYEHIKSAVYITGFENDAELGSIINWDKRLGKRIYDRFDFVEWFNKI